MATTTTTTTATQTSRSARPIPDGNANIKPNVRPNGLEMVPDLKWRNWRLRELRQDLRETYPEMWPPINPALRARATEEVNQQRANDPQREQGFQPRSLADLDGYRATQLQFLPLGEISRREDDTRLSTCPRKEYREEEHDKLPPFFFQNLSSDLFARVWEFATDTFGHKDWAGLVNDRDWTDYWLSKLPAEFVRSASVVARGDRVRGAKPGQDEHGYEYLFLEQHNRVYLCTAVIAKLLQENCFDALLFGATAEQKKTLNLLDKSTDGLADGYPRKLSRYDTIHHYLMGDLYTSNFWPEVDRVTNGILVVLLPLINMIGEFDESHSDEEERALWPDLTEVHQKLHNIVAEAAWLANGTSFSRSCFWTEFSQPGELWDPHQEHLTEVNWNASSQAAKDAFENSPAMRAWYAVRDTTFQEMQATQGLDMTLEEFTAARFLPHHPKPRDPVRRAAKVQICLWPFFDRHFPAHQNTANGGDSNRGEYVQTVQQAQVVYYAGEDSEEGDQKEDYTLAQHLLDWRKRNTSYAVRFWRFAFGLLPSWLVESLFWVGLAVLCLLISQPAIRYGVDEFIYRQSNRPLGPGHFVPGHFVPGHAAYGPGVDRLPRTEPLGHIVHHGPDIHVGPDGPPLTTTTGVLGDYLEQHANSVARDDGFAVQDDAPVPKHPLAPEDPTVTDTSSVSAETISLDPVVSGDGTPTTITVTRSGSSSKDGYHGHTGEVVVPVKLPSPDERQLSEDLLPESPTADEPTHDDLPVVPDVVEDSDQKGRQERSSRTPGLLSKIVSLITPSEWPTFGGWGPPAPPTHVPLEDDGFNDFLHFAAWGQPNPNAGDKRKVEEFWRAVEHELGHSVAAKAMEVLERLRWTPPKTPQQMQQIRNEVEVTFQFWRQYQERENGKNGKNGGAGEESPATVAQHEEILGASDALAAQPENVPEAPGTPVANDNESVIADTAKKNLPPTTVGAEKDLKEEVGKAEQEEASAGQTMNEATPVVGKVTEEASVGKATEEISVGKATEATPVGKATEEISVGKTTEEISVGKTTEVASVSKVTEEAAVVVGKVTDEATPVGKVTEVPILAGKATEEEASTDEATEKALMGKWVTTEVFGVPYNCWVSAGEATCTQTVSADGSSTTETNTATGDIRISAQDL